MTSEGQNHERITARLSDYAAGLVSETESKQIEAHLEICNICQDRLMQAERSAAAPLAGHLPELLVVRWDSAKRELRGLERELARRHLKRCESCRREILQRGFDPELEIVPDLEPSPEVLARLVRRIEPEPRDWTRVLLGGWAAAATAALLLVVIFGPGMMPGSDQNPEGPSRGVPAATNTPPAGQPSAPPSGSTTTSWVVLRLESPALLRPQLRGGLSGPAVLVLSKDARLVALRVDRLNIPDTSSVDVVITRANGDTLLVTKVANRELNSGHLVLADQQNEPLEPGLYLVRVSGGPAPDAILREPDVAEYRLLLRLPSSNGP